jgi:hypothetical protein
MRTIEGYVHCSERKEILARMMCDMELETLQLQVMFTKEDGSTCGVQINKQWRTQRFCEAWANRGNG